MSAGAGRTEPAVRGGRLTIFAGCAPGTGKTYAMLQAALRAQAAGVDVVTGTDGGRWPETRALAETLERLPGRAEAGELDLDAALERGPALLLVDDLGRTGPGWRSTSGWPGSWGPPLRRYTGTIFPTRLQNLPACRA